MNLEQFEVRRLGVEQLPEVEKILIQRSRIGKQVLEESQIQSSIESFKNSIINHPRAVYHHGAYANGILHSLLVQEFSLRFPDDWLMSFILTNPEIPQPWNYKKNGLDACWATAFELGRKYNRNVVRWSLPTDWSRSQERTSRGSDVWPKYKIELYSEIKAGELPEAEIDRWVFGERVKPYAVTLKKAYLHNLD